MSSPQSLAERAAVIEALIFVSDEPLGAKTIAEVLKEDKEVINQALTAFAEEFNARNGGLQLREVAGGWQFATRPEYHEHVRAFLKTRPSAKLTIASLETLAVIAYRQPITVPEILEIRGVQSPSSIKTLLDKKLIVAKGRKDTVGRPMMYGTSKEFLLQFGLKDLSELPSVEDFHDLSGGQRSQITRRIVEQRLQKLIAAAGIASRRHAEELIIAGRVTVNGEVVKELGTKADPDNDHIKVNGKLINPQLKAREKIYILLNKPKGYLSSVSDPEGRPLVTELLPPSLGTSSGRSSRLQHRRLLLLTNDGEFTNYVTAARNRVEKVYEVKVKACPRTAESTGCGAEYARRRHAHSARKDHETERDEDQHVVRSPAAPGTQSAGASHV